MNITTRCLLRGLVRCSASGQQRLFHLKGLPGYRSSSQLASSIPPYNDTEFRATLAKYPGGSVDVKMDASSGIALLTLNNPEKKNAFTGQMMLDLAACVAELESWDQGRAVIVHGAGGDFCSGGDLALVRDICNPVSGFHMSTFMQAALSRLLALPLVSVAAVQGRALGGGVEVATACDFRLLSQEAKVGFVQVRMGVTTGWGGGTRLTRLLGRQKALDLLASGRLLDASTAAELGFADHVIPQAENVVEAAQKWVAERYGRADVNLVRNMKRVVTSACSSDLDTSLLREREVFSETWGGPVQVAALNQNIKHKS